MVKSPHPIDNILASVSAAEDHRVRVTRVAGAAAERNGDAQPPDPVVAVLQALAEPLNYPPLAASIVPGDRVAVVLCDSVPCAAEIVRGVVDALQLAGIDADAISIVTTDAQTATRCREGIPDDSPAVPQFVIHNPEDSDNLCIVGVTKRQKPVRINRTIFDADVVLPIAVARLNAAGAYDGLYPQFSDAEAISRDRELALSDSPDLTTKRTEAANEAGWLIGVPMTIRVVPGAGESVAHVVVGEPQAVARRSDELYRRQWSMHIPQPVKLVIAAITGGPAAQTWANVGRALAAAERVLTEDGAVAICSNIEVRPGESLGRLIGSNDLAKTERKIRHDHAEDSWPAWHLARALQRGPVYFLSRLAPETVEDMGLAPVADLTELARLAERQENFLVIEDSQHAVVTVSGQITNDD